MNLRPIALSPIVKDGSIDQDGVQSIIMRNAGSATVRLWNGLYTLDPKETLSLNVTEHDGTLQIENLPVSFDTITGSLKRLEIVVLKAAKHC